MPTQEELEDAALDRLTEHLRGVLRQLRDPSRARRRSSLHGRSLCLALEDAGFLIKNILDGDFTPPPPEKPTK
jgi:hypothetical protein